MDGQAAVALPISALPISDTDRSDARSLLTRIGERFSENRQKSRSGAFEQYQRDISSNLGILVMGGALSVKEASSLLMDLEEFVKNTQREGETPGSQLAKFLRGELKIE